MPLSPRQRQLALGGALAATLGLVAWIGREPEESPEAPAPSSENPPGAPGKPAASHSSPPAAVGDVADLKLERGEAQAGTREIRNLFAEQTWVPPPPPAAAGPPPPPPLPFTYLGKLIDEGRVTLYLAAEERNLAVRQGDVINGTYRVKRIAPTAITFVYIPMNKQQTLDIGRSN